MEFSVEVTTITPELATFFIGEHKNYRTCSSTRLHAYAQEMREGRWGLSQITFDENGKLCDGQTRLRAVMETGLGQTFVVVHGWPMNQIKYIDNAQARTKGQVLRQELGIRDGSRRHAIARIIMGKRGKLILNSRAISIEERFGDVLDKITSVSTPHGNVKAAVVAGTFARAIIHFPGRTKDILEALRILYEMEFSEDRTSGLRLFRKYLDSRPPFANSGVDVSEAYSKCARAILCYLNNERVTRLLSVTYEPFPCPGCSDIAGQAAGTERATD